MAIPRGGPGVDDVDDALALEFELTHWPRYVTRAAWWRRQQDRLPPELRDDARPDPRRILGDVVGTAHRAYEAAEAAWREGRIRWLRAQAAESEAEAS